MTQTDPTPPADTPAPRPTVQDLSRFGVQPGFRGRSVVVVQLWNIVQATLFSFSPWRAFAWRRFLLRLFGARIGKDVQIRPNARIVYPWFVTIGDHAWVGEDVVLYSFGQITIGAHACISQKSYLCAGSHDYRDETFAMTKAPICIGRECWIATDVFIAPGVTVGDGTVVGARSSVFSDLPAMTVCIGSPARPVRDRLASDGAVPS